MVKKAVTLYIEEDLVTDLKKRNYNISHLCNEAMRVYVTNDLCDIETSARLSAIDVILGDLKTVMVKKQLEYDKATADYESMLVKRRQIEDDYVESQQTLRMSRLIQELNKNIIALEYKIPAIQETCSGMIEKMVEISPTFNLEAHVKRLQQVLS